MKRGLRGVGLMFLAIAVSIQAAAEVRVTDAVGRELVLANPAQRVVSLAPHTTEMLFALGAGDRIVATVRFADHPPEARRVPRIGDAFSVSLEALLASEPELVVAWASGSPTWLVTRLDALGVPLYLSAPTRLTDIGRELLAMGALLGEASNAETLAATLQREIDALGDALATAPRTFFQISRNPIYTVSDQHIIGAAMRRCALNVFGELNQASPQVSLEAVVAMQPERIVVTVDEAHTIASWKKFWGQWGWEARLVFVPADLLSRPGPRMVEGVKIMCEGLGRAVSGDAIPAVRTRPQTRLPTNLL